MLPTLILVTLASLHTPASFLVNYVFTVPVRIENMTHVRDALVSCYVNHTAPGLTSPLSIGEPSGNIPNVLLRDGNFTGNVTVTVVVDQIKLAAYPPTEWGCRISYRFTRPEGVTYNETLSPTEREAIYTRLTGQEITSSTVVVTGTLPPP